MRKWTMLLAALLLVAAACGDDPAGVPPEGTLIGLFGVDAGECDDAGVTSGSYFRMVQADGTVGDGPYMANGDSPCGDQTYTPLEPGDDGGLRTGAFQEHPDPPFEDGHGTASAILAPQRFFAVDFAVATNPVDPQTGIEASGPIVTADGGQLSADLRAFGVGWNEQHFNQGSPKPDGEMPGNTQPVSGTYDPDTGRYTLTWASQIEGGPFENFTGVWHLEGTFEAGD